MSVSHECHAALIQAQIDLLEVNLELQGLTNQANIVRKETVHNKNMNFGVRVSIECQAALIQTQIDLLVANLESQGLAN